MMLPDEPTTNEVIKKRLTIRIRDCEIISTSGSIALVGVPVDASVGALVGVFVGNSVGTPVRRCSIRERLPRICVGR